MFENLDKKFDVADTPPEKILEVSATIVEIEPTPEVSDEEVSRQALRDMIQRGRDAVEDASNLASASESPRAYEVLAQMIKTVSDSSKDLLLLQKIKKDIGKKEKSVEGPRTQNNLFVGSTADLMKALAQTTNLEVLPPTETP